MSVLLKKIVAFPQSNSSRELNVIDDIRTNIKIDMKAKGSGGDIILKNANSKYVLTTGEFQFQQQDTIKVYAKYTDDGTETTDDLGTDDLIITMEVVDTQADLSNKNTSWTLSCADKTYLLLNKLWAKVYLKSDNPVINGIVQDGTGDSENLTGWTAPEILAHIINITVPSITAKLTTNGGSIAALRSNDTAFPRGEFSIAKVFKPVYEWADDLSQVERTNSIAEQTGTLIDKRPYIFFIDEKNVAHWEYPNTDSYDYEMTVGSSTVVGDDTVRHIIRGHKLKKSTFDIVNFIIFNAGQDFNDSGTLNYFYDKNSKSPTLKPVYKPFLDIADDWKGREIQQNSTYYTENNDTGTLIIGSKKYDADYSTPFRPIWAAATGDSTVSSDSELNDSLRTFLVLAGKHRAESIIKGQSNARWKGTIVLRGYNYRVGNLIKFNSAVHGIKDVKVRVMIVQHNFSKNGWSTTLSVEEDPLEREASE